MNLAGEDPNGTVARGRYVIYQLERLFAVRDGLGEPRTRHSRRDRDRRGRGDVRLSVSATGSGTASACAT
eukprot:7052566-Alexandrium_andersonii.AAC.1